jgi:hypothetical protein
MKISRQAEANGRHLLSRNFTYQQVFENVNRTGNSLGSHVEIEQRVLLALPDSRVCFQFLCHKDRRRAYSDKSDDRQVMNT